MNDDEEEMTKRRHEEDAEEKERRGKAVIVREQRRRISLKRKKRRSWLSMRKIDLTESYKDSSDDDEGPSSLSRDLSPSHRSLTFCCLELLFCDNKREEERRKCRWKEDGEKRRAKKTGQTRKERKKRRDLSFSLC